MPTNLRPTRLPDHVRYCAVCGVESSELMLSNDGEPMCPDEIRCMSRAIAQVEAVVDVDDDDDGGW